LDGLARLDAQVLVADERIAQGIEARLLVAVRPASVQTGARSGMRIAQSQPTGDARIVIVGVIDAGRPVELETGLRAIACFDERRASDAIEIEIAGHDREARSEERRVGKEGRARWAANQGEKYASIESSWWTQVDIAKQASIHFALEIRNT